MATEVDLQMMIFIVFFAGATLLVALTRRRKRRFPVAERCSMCGRTLDSNLDREGLCRDCYKLGRV
jgi:hypothetical protein